MITGKIVVSSIQLFIWLVCVTIVWWVVTINGFCKNLQIISCVHWPWTSLQYDFHPCPLSPISCLGTTRTCGASPWSHQSHSDSPVHSGRPTDRDHHRPTERPTDRDHQVLFSNTDTLLPQFILMSSSKNHYSILHINLLNHFGNKTKSADPYSSVWQKF